MSEFGEGLYKIEVSESLKARFHKYTQTGDDCWIWIGLKDTKGYGRMSISKNNKAVPVFAHRVSWSIHNDSTIPSGMCVCHSCDNPSCVNPDHLFLGTIKDNVQDCINKGRKTHPPHPAGVDHPEAKFTEDQVREIRKRYVRRSGPPTNLVSIAADYGVVYTAIQKIVTGETYKNVV